MNAISEVLLFAGDTSIIFSVKNFKVFSVVFSSHLCD